MRSYSWLKWGLLAFTLVAFVSCSNPQQELDQTEAAAINNVFKTGVTFDRDPYVRAETFRVMELLADPSLSTYAEVGLEDTVPMVRLAALRAMMASKAPDASTAAQRVFTRGSNAEKHAVLSAVAEYDDGPSRRELLGRALRSTDPALRQLAFKANVLERVDKAAQKKDEDALRNNLYPELGRYVGLDKDPALASLAIRKFLDLGQTDRIDPLLRTLEKDRAKLELRVLAGRILMNAKASEAADAFEALIQKHTDVLNDDTLGVPDDVVPPPLLRIAVLGSVAAGKPEHVKRAKKYMNNVTEEQALEVLEALGGNASEDAAVTLKVALQDSRRSIRMRAIELYRDRRDADPRALIAALKGADFETQKRLSSVLMARFREPWVKALEKQLQRTSELERTLELLRDVVTNDEEAKALLVPLRSVLEQVQKSEEGKRQSTASYLLALISKGDEAALAAENLDEPTRYAYLEFLVRTSPNDHLATFRRYLYDDLFVVRLMAAAGLWRVLGSNAPPAAEGEAEGEGEAPATSDAGGAS